MRIAVIGAGGLGSTFAGKLAQYGADVRAVDTNARHVEAIAAKGLTVRDPQGEFTVPLAATTRIEAVRDIDVALILVDTNATAAVAPQLPAVLSPSGFALTLQNGIGNVEALAEALGPERVLGGSTYMSAAMIGPGHVHNTNIGENVVGELGGGVTPRGAEIARLFTQAGLPTQTTSNVMGHIWSKFALNCALNPLSAIAGLRPGEVMRQPEMRALLDEVIAEILAVVKAKNIRLPEEDPAGHIRAHANERYNRPSMLQHVRAGRPTEIGSLNAALVRHAEQLGIAVPANRTIVALIRGLEARAARGDIIDEAALEAEARAPKPAE